MIPLDITFFEVSPEIVFDGHYGHMVSIAYSFDVDNTLLNSEVVKYCDFIEQIVFRLEWKRVISSNESVLIKARELPAYPTKKFMLSAQNKRSTKCFLSREFLSVEPSFPERAELFCRISLLPLLASQRKSLSYQPHGAFYILDNSSNGDESTFESGDRGTEY